MTMACYHYILISNIMFQVRYFFAKDIFRYDYRFFYIMTYLLIFILSNWADSVNGQERLLSNDELEQANEYRSIEEALREPKKVYKLNLENNSLTVLPNQIEKLKNLQELNLKRNQLTHLPAAIGKLKNLQILNLHDNQLNTLPDQMRNLLQLDYLDLRHNPGKKSGLEKVKKLLPNVFITF